MKIFKMILMVIFLLFYCPVEGIAIYIPNSFLSKSSSRAGEAGGSLIQLLKGLPAPKSEDKDVRSLLYELGNDYDPEYTSILEPDSLKSKHRASQSKDIVDETMQTHPQMSKDLKNMKLKKVYSKERKGKRTELGRKTSHRLKNWLWDLSKCPVYYRWMDMGERIFPRYVKRGECSKKKTCSFPAGMKCKKKSWKRITVLINLCIKQFNLVSLSPAALECKWRMMNINVLTECQCGCLGSNKK